MANIFNWDARKGTLIDSVSKTAGTLTAGNGGFKKTEKGTALKFDGSVTNLSTTILLTNIKTIVLWLKPYDNTTLLLDNTSNKLQISGNNYSGTGLTKNYVNNINRNLYIQDQWQMVVSEFNLGIDFLTNLKLIATSKVLICKVKIYNTLLNTQERNNLYKEFLRSSPTEKAVKGFEYPKPTDLSNEDGLVSAYNMIPSNGTLVDISGNGNNGTIHGAISIKDGLKFDGVDDYLSVLNDINDPIDFNGKSFSILHRFKTTDSSIRLANNRGLGVYGVQAGWQVSTNNTATWGNIGIDDGLGHSLNYNDVEYNENDYLWHDIILTFDSTSGESNLYIDGVLKSSHIESSLIGANLNSGRPLRIGVPASDVSSQQFNGKILDIKIYNYAFTVQQAAAYHNSFIKPDILEDFSNNAIGDTL